MKPAMHHAARLMCLALALAAGPAASAQDAPTVELRDYAFEPATLTIKAGATVTWKNLDSEPHVVVDGAGKFRSPALDTNDTWQHRFDRPGVYKIFCGIHPSMRETITVR